MFVVLMIAIRCDNDASDAMKQRTGYLVYGRKSSSLLLLSSVKFFQYLIRLGPLTRSQENHVKGSPPPR